MVGVMGVRSGFLLPVACTVLYRFGGNGLLHRI